MSPGPPQLVADRYRLVAPLGQGGMGRVWRATDVVLHREVAIKELVPPPGLTAEERQEMRERSLREARAIARLNNINVVRVFDVLRTDGDPWIVMEYVPSRSLQDTLAVSGPVPPARAAEIGLGVLNALRAAHRAGVVHRDVKPGNVLLGEEGRVVLTDFGLATVPGDPNVTRTGLVLGSPAYISPERARDGTAGPKADLWSLGATLYAAVEGASPYARSSAIATLAALATENPPPAKNAGPLKAVLNGLLRKDPAQRISADEAERLLLRATGRRARLTLPMSPTMRRPGAGRDRDAGHAGPLTMVSGSAPVVPGPRPPASPLTGAGPGQAGESNQAGASGQAAGPARVFRPGRAVVGKAPVGPAPVGMAAAVAPPAVDPPTQVDDAPVPRIDAPTKVEAGPGGGAAVTDAPTKVDTLGPAAPAAPAPGDDEQPAQARAVPEQERADRDRAAADPAVADPATARPAVPEQGVRVPAAVQRTAEGDPQPAEPDQVTGDGDARSAADGPSGASAAIELAERSPNGTTGGVATEAAAHPAGPEQSTASGQPTVPEQSTMSGQPTVPTQPGSGPDGPRTPPRPAGLKGKKHKRKAARAAAARKAETRAAGTDAPVAGAPVPRQDAESSRATPGTTGPMAGGQPRRPARTSAEGSRPTSTPPSGRGAGRPAGALAGPPPRRPVGTAASRAGTPPRRPAGAPSATAALTGRARPASFLGRLTALLPDQPARRRRLLLVVAILAVALLAVAIIVPLVIGDDARTPREPGRPSGAATGQAANPPVAPASPAPDDPTPEPSDDADSGDDAPPGDDGGVDIELPDGWRIHEDETGFSVPVPADWSVSRKGTEVYFQERGGRGRLLIVDQTRRPKPDPVKDWKQQESVRRANYRNYDLIRIAAVDYWDKAADWEFRNTTARGNRLHVRKRGFITAPDQAYGIHWSTLESDWRANMDELELIYEGFVPARQ